MIFNFSMLIIILIVYIFCELSQKYKSEFKSELFLKISFFLIFILSCFRSFKTGTDTMMYAKAYIEISKMKWSYPIFNGYFEPLFAIFNVMLSYTFKNPRILLIATSGFIDYSLYKFIRENSKNYFLSIILFFELMFFYDSINIIRQYMAIAILLFGFKFIREKKLLIYLIYVAIAYLFHSSAIVGILLYFAYNVKYYNKISVIFLAFAILFNVFMADIIDKVYLLIGRTNFYSNRIGLDNVANIVYFAVYFALFVFCYCLIGKSNKSNKNFYLYTFLLAACFSVMAMKLNVLSRATMYFSIFSIVMIPNLITENIKSIQLRKTISLVICVISVCYITIIIKFRPNWNTAFNYELCAITDNNSLNSCLELNN